MLNRLVHLLSLCWGRNIEDKDMSKGIRPEFGIKVAANEKSLDTLSNCVMSSFDGTMLKRGIGACWIDFKTSFFKHILNFGVTKYFLPNPCGRSDLNQHY